jgi:hypothetical protein
MSTFANILTGGLAWAVDSTRGADNKYEGAVSLALRPASAVPMEAAPPEPSPPEAAPNAPPRTSRVTPTPVAVPAMPSPAPPAGPQLECSAADGSRIRVTGGACPAGWTAVR